MSDELAFGEGLLHHHGYDALDQVVMEFDLGSILEHLFQEVQNVLDDLRVDRSK